LVLFGAGQARAVVKFGVNFQSDVYDENHVTHPIDASIAGFASAFGVPAADWIEPGVIFGELPSTPFSTPTMSGATVNLSASNYLLGRGYTNGAMIHYGDPILDPTRSGTAGPQTGEEAVLASFIFAISEEEAPGLGADAHVTFTGLAAVAAAAGVPLNYKVSVLSTSEWHAEFFSPAIITDNAAHTQTVDIIPIPGSEVRWSTSARNFLRYVGNGGRGDSNPIFTGDTVDISVVGRNETIDSVDRNLYGRSNIAGVIVEFVPAAGSSVPEPSTFVLLGLGGLMGCVAAWRRRARVAAVAVATLCVFGSSAMDAKAVSIGAHWAGNLNAFGPYSLTTGGPWSTPAYPSAFGVTANNWFEPGADPSAAATAFSPAAGGTINVAWQSSYPDGHGSEGTYVAYGYAHANMGLPGEPANGDGFAGAPQSGEEAVLAGGLYALSTAGGDAVDRPITVTISGLGSVATASGVPLSYKVHLMASSHYEAQVFTPATVADNNAHSETLNFSVLAFHPRWNTVLRSSGGTADSTTVFNGDSLTITLTGADEYNKSALAPGDVNSDGIVNIFDINFVSSNWNGPGPAGDANGDHIVNIFDINLISSNWNATGSGQLQYGRTALAGVSIEFVPAATTAVPEPQTFALGALAALGGMVVVYRQRRG